VREAVSIVGLGRVGTALAAALKERGYILKSLADKDLGALERARLLLGGDISVSSSMEDVGPAEVFLITVRDDAIFQVASFLRSRFPRALLVHTSGLHSSHILGEGPRLAMHPLQSFASVREALENLPASLFSLEGDARGLEWGRKVVESLGGHSMELEASQKPLYHLAACIASNYLITLLHEALRAMEEAGMERGRVLPGLIALMRGTLRNADGLGVPQALTGPMVRGDVGTIESHLRALEGREGMKEFYLYMARKTLEMIREGGLPTPKSSLEAMETLIRKESSRSGGR